MKWEWRYAPSSKNCTHNWKTNQADTNLSFSPFGQISIVGWGGLALAVAEARIHNIAIDRSESKAKAHLKTQIIRCSQAPDFQEYLFCRCIPFRQCQLIPYPWIFARNIERQPFDNPHRYTCLDIEIVFAPIMEKSCHAQLCPERSPRLFHFPHNWSCVSVDLE